MKSSQPIPATLALLLLGLVAPAAQAALPAGTQAYYSFNNAAELGADLSANANHLSTATGTPGFSASGKHGGALYLNGSSSMTRTAGFPTGFPVGGASYTLAVWEKLDAGASNGGYLGWGNHTNNQCNNLRRDGAEVVNYWYYNDQFSSGAAINDSNWHHVAATYDSATKIHSIYVDGVLRGQRTVTTVPAVVAANFAVGRTTATSEFHNGWLDDLLVANRALSLTEITGLMNGTGSDSDGDALNDEWEMSYAANLTDLTGLASGPGPGAGSGDFDGDGLPDRDELSAGTNPTLADTDGDTFADGLEVNSMHTNPLAADDPPPAGSLRNKTLVAWVRLDDLLQTGSGVLAIQDGNEFDAITFGERAAGRWMAGSHNFSRTQSPAEQQALAPETATPDQWLQLAVVYRGKQIEIWRNGQLYTAYEAANQQTYADQCDLYLGMRCLFSNQVYGFLKGAINEARIYNSALDAAAIAQLTPGTLNGPAPLGCWTFDGGSVKDVMGHYPDAQLSGTATVRDGALVLDGQGYALISQHLIADYRPPTVHAGFYTPPHRVGLMWDTWIYWHAGMYYMYYIAGPFVGWDAHEIAVSRDGVYWHYQGVAVTPRPQTAWIGTGHVWKSPAFANDGQWILNYSECMGDNKQDIMFATSPDLLHWTKVAESLRFVQDTRWYQAAGRWDCIDAIAGDDGWLYGYFTADPDPAKVSYAHCGFGFARSSDGRSWEALPPVPGNMTGEFGGIQKIDGKYYITVSEGRVGVATSPMGPFIGQPKNSNVFGGDIYFPRFFHTAPDGPLMNHFYTGGPIYAAPLKAVNIDAEGILRLVWWPGNDKLKAAQLPVTLQAPQGAIQWLDTSFDVNQTLVIEGTANLPATGPAAGELFGLLLDQGNGTAQCVSLERTLTRFGEVSLNAQPLALSARQTANRDLDLGTRQHFRILLNRDMMEVYVNDYLTILARVKNTGRFGLLTGTAPGGIENLQVWRSGGLDTWASGFPALTDKSPAGDPDHDGIPNLMEYVIGGDPRLAGSSHLPTAARVGSDLVLSYQRRDESETDTTALGQWSTDMHNWTNIAPVMVNENAAAPDSMEIRIPLSNAVGGKLFGRLNVTQH